MGRNNQQRRADKKRRAARQQSTRRGPAGDPLTMRLGEAAMENLVLMAARAAFGAGEDHVEFAETVSALMAIETSPTAPHRPSSAVANLLAGCVANLCENGWQPADIVHTVKRQWTARASRLAVAVIAGDARRCDAANRAPLEWLSQLDDLGVYDPARQVIVGGHDPVGGWARSERLDPDETLTISLQVLAQLMMSGREATLIDPPSAWGASNRGVTPKAPAAHGDIDAKALKLIRALLAKAEATTFENEAEAFTAKAQEMMTRYSIDAAVLASAGRNLSDVDPDIQSRRFHLDSPYADEKASFLSVIASVNGARCIWSPHVGFATVMGYAVDLQLTDLLFTSLIVQAARASAEATSADRRLRTPSFRRAFLIAFADRIGERLEATQQHAAAEAEQQYGSSLLPILASRQAAVEEAYTNAFPNATVQRSRRLNAHGWHAGRAAADRANIGRGQAIAST
jgi:Protein of unknown function (DUF2786)